MSKADLPTVNEKLSASSLRVEEVSPGQCDLAEKNARYMTAEQYRRLVENIRADGCLTSVPFAVKRGGRYLILSGNHRVQAARDAGLTKILVLCTDQDLSAQKQRALQLSHNAVVGQDDLAILRELYDEINDLALREYSGLDDAMFGRMEPPDLDPLSEVGLEVRVVTVAFLPSDIARVEETLDKVLARSLSDKTWVNRFADYDRFLDALTVARERAGVKNTATAFSLLLDLIEKHLDEMPEKAPAKAPSESSVSEGAAAV